MGLEYGENRFGGIVMNDDNDRARRMVEMCYRTTKTMVNPIIDWEEEDVWQFLNENGIEHCSLYDEGFKRLGCIGCPLGGTKNMQRDFDRWPRYKELYIRAFQKTCDDNPYMVKILDEDYLEERRKKAEELGKTFVERQEGETAGQTLFRIWIKSVS